MFQKEISQKHKNEGALIKLGGVPSIGAHLGPSSMFWKGVTSGGSNPACLGELGGNHLPPFSYKMGWMGAGEGVEHLWELRNHLKLVRRRRKKEKIQAEALP